MSDDKKTPNPDAHKDATPASPSDARTQPRRFEPITHEQDEDDGDEESTRTTGTVRRNRPPAITTSSGDNYGMLSSTDKE